MQINRNENNQGLKGEKMGEKTNLSVAFDAALHWLTRSDFYCISPWRPRGGSIAPYLKGDPGCWRKKEKRVFMKKPVHSAVNSSRQKKKRKEKKHLHFLVEWKAKFYTVHLFWQVQMSPMINRRLHSWLRTS